MARYDLIAHEDLKIQNMAKGHFAKGIMDAAWGILLFQLAYKAESAGRYVIAVNPRNTSQLCSGCGALVRKKFIDLDVEATHHCICSRAGEAKRHGTASGPSRRSVRGRLPLEAHKLPGG